MIRRKARTEMAGLACDASRTTGPASTELPARTRLIGRERPNEIRKADVDYRNCSVRDANERGTVVGCADTSTPNPNYPNFNPFLSPFGADPFIFHTFEFKGGRVTDMG